MELPFHRLEAAKLDGAGDLQSPLWTSVADLLTDWQFLETKAEKAFSWKGSGDES